MRKFIALTLVILFSCAISAVAQTYCFKPIESGQIGVISRLTGTTYQYFTFQNNMSRFYVSDANGYAGQTPLIYNLISTANGRYKYQQQGPMGPIGNYYIFNSDFSRANATSNFLPGVVTVSKRVDGSEDEDDEEEFY